MLVNATDLEVWANRRDSQASLPRLVRRLVYATADRIRILRFPSGDSVQAAGWDGVAVVDSENIFVPAGISGWELSSNRNVTTKANEDFEKRTNDPGDLQPSESAFIFVTPRRWTGKEKWVKSKQKEGPWRDVRAYDANDLEQWLELAPAVHIWISIELGKRTQGAVDIQSFWEDWSQATRPVLTPEFMLAGRAEAVGRVHAWLRGGQRLIAVKADVADEAVAVIAASLEQLPDIDKGALSSRSLVVRDLEVWQRVSASEHALILLPQFDVGDAITGALRRGHRIAVPLGRSDSEHPETLILPRLMRSKIAEILVANGMTQEKAYASAALASRSLSVFRRQHALSPETQQPRWARPGEGRTILFVLLAGKWNDSFVGDRESLEALTGRSYEALREEIVRWSHEEDSPVKNVGSTWFVTSKIDAWTLVGRYLIHDDTVRLEGVMLRVLGTHQAQYDPADDIELFLEAMRYPPTDSGLLRGGLADTLALLGARGDAQQAALASRVVRDLLGASAGWEAWASLSDHLPLLAEAAPDVFIEAVKAGLAGQTPVLSHLTNRLDLPSVSRAQAGLVWALETLAWSSDYLGYAASLLAELSKLVPRDDQSNMPFATLRDILLLWHPQTSASLDQRLLAIDSIVRQEPEVGWRLLCCLLPEVGGGTSGTRIPMWRDWQPESQVAVSHAEYGRGIREIVSRMLPLAGHAGDRWKTLIGSIASLPGDQFERVARHLEEMNPEEFGSPDRVAISGALRSMISTHRSFAGAQWAMPGPLVSRLEGIYDRIQPGDPSLQLIWLFERAPALLEGHEQNWEARESAILDARLKAVKEVCSLGGVADLLGLLARVEQPGELGVVLGKSGISGDEGNALLSRFLDDTSTAHAQFARGLVFGFMGCRGREWCVRNFIESSARWSVGQRAEYLTCLPFERPTWLLAENAGPDSEERYWKGVNPRGAAEADNEYVVKKLLDYGRPRAGVGVLAARARTGEPSAMLVVEVLERAMNASIQEDPPIGPLSYEIGVLLDFLDGLDASKEIAPGRVAALEWGYIPVLHRSRAPKTLHRQLATNPSFFAQIVSVVYRAERDEPSDWSEDERLRAQAGDDLLRSWSTVPGTRPNNDIDAHELIGWLCQARSSLERSGHQAIGDFLVGQVLSGSSSGADGAWPHEAVRDAIERVASAELDNGFTIGILNTHGLVGRSLTEGGVQDRSVAAKFEENARVIGPRWPRVAASLRRMAKHFREAGEKADQESILWDELGHL